MSVRGAYWVFGPPLGSRRDGAAELLLATTRTWTTTSSVPPPVGGGKHTPPTPLPLLPTPPLTHLPIQPPPPPPPPPTPSPPLVNEPSVRPGRWEPIEYSRRPGGRQLESARRRVMCLAPDAASPAPGGSLLLAAGRERGRNSNLRA